MLKVKYIVALGVLLFSATLTAEENEAEEIVKANLIRIGFYKMAHVQQTKAMNLCRWKLKDVEKKYENQVGSPDSDQDELYHEYMSERNELESLLKTYLSKTVSTMKTLSSEYQTMASAQAKLGLYKDAYETMVQSSVQWDEVASIYEGYADDYQKAFHYNKAGSAYETAFSTYETARSKWVRTLSYAKTDGRKAEAQTHIEQCSLNGIRVLGTAANSYLTSFQQHVEAAGGGDIDIYARSAGSEWITAANMHRKHEQITKKVKRLVITRSK